MRTLIIGLDAFDPAVFEGLVAQGKMPVLEKYTKTGGYSRFGVSNPPQSEVSWTSISTGLDPGSHGLFDFVHRNPSNYSLSASVLPTRKDVFGTRFVPPNQANTIFDQAVRQGYPATVLWWPATFPARLESPVRTLPGFGTPDIHGRLGVGSLFTVDRSLQGESFKTSIEILNNPRPGYYTGSLKGPGRKQGNEVEHSRAEIALKIFDDKTASLKVGEVKIDLVVGEWSPIIDVNFRMSHFYSLCGITRVIMTHARPHPRLYFLPLQIHPLKTPWRYTSSRSFVKKVWKSAGPFLTLGWPQDTTALEEGWIDDNQFLDLCETIFCTREKILSFHLSQMNDGILASVFDTLDRIQHMYWRDRPDIIEGWYLKLDRLVGGVEERMIHRSSGQTNLVIVSDHGFTTFDYKVHLNRWLIERGFLVPLNGSETGSLKEIDWSASKAYAAGLNSLYLNLEGRESQGCVSAQDKHTIGLRIRDELMAWRGPNGRPVIHDVYSGADAFSGHLSQLSPDFVIGYANGFRASGETGLGSWKSASIEENHDHWNGDHCVDPHIVPGVIFSNQGLRHFPAPTFRQFPTIAIDMEIEQSNSPPPRMPKEDQATIDERLKGLGYL